MKTYKTSEIAAIIGIHPNTVRLYEKLNLITKPERQENGYRIFTDLHIHQFQLARTAFQIEMLQNGLRKKIVDMVKLAAQGDVDQALVATYEYIDQLQKERLHAEEAIESVKQVLSGNPSKSKRSLKRKEVSELLDISMDSLRNWEMNGLLTVKRKQNGYRVYSDEDLQRLNIIRSLRCANYSIESILHMLNQLADNPQIDIEKTLNTPQKNTDIISVCDKLNISLLTAETNATKILDKLHEMKTLSV